MSGGTDQETLRFSANGRCLACQQRDLKCVSDRTDSRCFSCAGADRECLFTRTITIQGPERLLAVYTALEQEPLLSSAGSVPAIVVAPSANIDNKSGESSETQKRMTWRQKEPQSLPESVASSSKGTQVLQPGISLVFDSMMNPISSGRNRRVSPSPVIEDDYPEEYPTAE